MEDWREGFYAALADYINSVHPKYDVAKVESVWQDDPSPYYCETCGPDPVTVIVGYVDSQGEPKNYAYYGHMGDLISNL